MRSRDVAEIRRRSEQTEKSEQNISTFKNLDFFTKIKSNSIKDKENRIQTTFGGLISIFGLLLITWLILCETYYFIFPNRTEHLIVDKMFNEKLNIKFDIEFNAIACNALAIDVMDITGEQQLHVGKEITKQRLDINGNKIGEVFHEKDGVPMSPLNLLFFQAPKMENINSEGCRIKGKLHLQKVSGNFHLALGRAHEINGKHIHQFSLTDIPKFNCSHVIHYLSFGNEFKQQMLPLNGIRHVIEKEGSGVFTYNIKIVPIQYLSTIGYSTYSNLYTYEYIYRHIRKANNPMERMITAALPGVFFVYHMNPYMLQISDERQSFFTFVVNLCAIVGGVFAISSLLDRISFHFISFSYAKKLFSMSDENSFKI